MGINYTSIRLAFLILALQHVVVLRAQVLMNRDSLLKAIPLAKEDSNKVLLLINTGQQFESNAPETAKFFYRSAMELSQKINYPLGFIKYAANYTFVLNMQGYYDSSLSINLKALEKARVLNDSEYLAKTLFNTGNSYRVKGEYETAVKYYEEGKKIFQHTGDPVTEARYSDILQLLYHEMRQYKRGIEYGEKAVAALRKIKDSVWLCYTLNNLGLNYSGLNDFTHAEKLFKEALNIGIQINDKNSELSELLNLGDILLQQGNYDKMMQYYQRALVLSITLEEHESELIANKGLSFYYQYKKQYTLAKEYADKALGIAYQYNLRVERQKLLVHFSNLSYSMQDMKMGEYYAVQSTLLEDSILNETIQKNTLDIEKKYETEKKENQIKKLQAEKKLQELTIRQKNILNYSLISGAVVLCIISLLGYRTYQQKQKLQQQRIAELETQQQLTATEAVLKGEEQERVRLAKDLHDGLGGMLSGIKYSMKSMRGNLILTPDTAQAFERSMDMLDSSIKEMRRVAHNMMPEALVKFGLNTALKDFCNDINQSGAIKLNYQSIGMDNSTIDQTTSIAIYRIVQELVNNTIKHAAAKTAIVQLTQSDNLLSLTVEDDGIGFDPVILQRVKGIGWSNIQSRVDFLKGTLDVQSGAGKGTSVHIELNA